MLRRRFEHVFPSEFTLTEFPTPVTWPPLAALHFATAITHDEWLSLAVIFQGMRLPAIPDWFPTKLSWIEANSAHSKVVVQRHPITHGQRIRRLQVGPSARFMVVVWA